MSIADLEAMCYLDLIETCDVLDAMEAASG
jgi:hypothetical protein